MSLNRAFSRLECSSSSVAPHVANAADFRVQARSYNVAAVVSQNNTQRIAGNDDLRIPRVTESGVK